MADTAVTIDGSTVVVGETAELVEDVVRLTGGLVALVYRRRPVDVDGEVAR